MSPYRRRFRCGPSVDASRRPGCLAKLQCRRQIGGNRLSLFLGLDFQPNQIPLELAEVLLSPPDILSQCGQIWLHGLGDVSQIMSLTELMRNTRQSLGNCGSQPCFLVGYDPDDGKSEGGQLPDEGHQFNLSANEGFLAKQGNSRQPVDDQIDNRLAGPIVDGIYDGQKEAPGSKFFKHRILGRCDAAGHKGFIFSALILDAHFADRKAPFLEGRMDSRKAKVLMKTEVANFENDIKSEFVVGKSNTGLFGAPKAKMALIAYRRWAPFISHDKGEILGHGSDRTIAMLADLQVGVTKRAILIGGCKDNSPGNAGRKFHCSKPSGKINVPTVNHGPVHMYSPISKILAPSVAHGYLQWQRQFIPFQGL